MFPVPTLPNGLFTSRTAAGVTAREVVFEYIFSREGFLYETPTRRIVEIVVGQCPQRMHVVGQYHLCFENKGSSLLNSLNSSFQNPYSLRLSE
jgi:hypothetical protein